MMSSGLVQRVHDQNAPVAAFKLVGIVKRLPKTRSGMILRGTMVNVTNGNDWKMPATINDPAFPDKISAALQ